jgi:hypothetical protein
VRRQVTKAIKHATWYFFHLLTIFIVHRESATKKIGKIYTWSTRSTAEGETMAMAVITMESSSKDKPKTNTVQFKTDSMTVGVDNRCTMCISDKREHFVGELTLGRKVIKGFHRSKTTRVMSGTIQWKWPDSNRLEHMLRIPGLFYILEGKCRLLSPQHWALAHKEATSMQAWEVTDDQGCMLYWEGGRKHLTIPLGNKDNVVTMQLTPGYSKYHKFSDNASTTNTT